MITDLEALVRIHGVDGPSRVLSAERVRACLEKLAADVLKLRTVDAAGDASSMVLDAIYELCDEPADDESDDRASSCCSGGCSRCVGVASYSGF